MEDILTRMMGHFMDRVTGPMWFRFLLQPAMAIYFAVRAGLEDARTGKSPYFWGLMTDPEHRAEMLKSGWKSVGKVFLLALALDLIYQVMVLKFFFPIEALIIAFSLAFVPYLMFRGLVTRIARK